MTETYFDFDSETLQITQRKRFSESSGYGSSTPGLSPFGLVKFQEQINSSEDTGFESSSDRSSLTLSQDGLLLESPRSASPKSTSSNSHNFHWPLCQRASLESLGSKPLRRYGSKESIKSSSSFWDSNFPPETKAVLSKVRDQMRASLNRVKELEEQAKQIPLLQVKISILQEEKRQLASQLKSIKTNRKKSRSSFDCSEGETRSVGVGDHSIHDILCKKCKEIQDKLLGYSCSDQTDPNRDVHESYIGRHKLFTRAVNTPNSQNDVIMVFQDRCTQTRPTEHKDNSVQATITDDQTGVKITESSCSLQQQQRSDLVSRTFQDRSCDPIPVETRSIGVGQIGSYMKDACVGKDRAIPTVADFGVQKIADVKDKSCGVQKVETESIGINVSPTLMSVGTGCSFIDKSLPNFVQHKYSIASQTIMNASSHVSVGVGMFSVDDVDECDCYNSKKTQAVSVGEILESNKHILSAKSVGITTCSWEELERKIVVDHTERRSSATIGVSASIPTRSVGCGDHSVTDTDCHKCIFKSSRSLGVDCKPKVSEVAVGGDVPFIAHGNKETCIPVKPQTSCVGVGECCVTDNYCERCFSLQTRTIGVGNGSIFDHFVDGQDLTCNAPGDAIPEDGSKDSDVMLQYYDISSTAQSVDNIWNCEVKPVEKDLGASERMFSEEYKRITDDWISDYDDKKIKRLINPDEDILLYCDLLQKHFRNEEQLDENKLLLCMKSIEDYWFNCVTEPTLEKQFMSELLNLLKQNLPLLLDGLINSQDENGNTALHYLVTYGKFDCVNELLATDLCDLNITNKAGYSAVMLGSLKECNDEKDKIVLKCLFEKGNLNSIAQSTGQTALMLAAGTGRVDTVDLLLQCGAAQSVNTTDLDGSTALMCACEHGYAAVVKLLLAVSRCDATIKDHDGSTCFSIAMEQNRKDIALMIYNHLQLQGTSSPNMVRFPISW